MKWKDASQRIFSDSVSSVADLPHLENFNNKNEDRQVHPITKLLRYLIPAGTGYLTIIKQNTKSKEFITSFFFTGLVRNGRIIYPPG